jgi:hypothetical protein
MWNLDNWINIYILLFISVFTFLHMQLVEWGGIAFIMKRHRPICTDSVSGIATCNQRYKYCQHRLLQGSSFRCNWSWPFFGCFHLSAAKLGCFSSFIIENEGYVLTGFCYFNFSLLLKIFSEILPPPLPFIMSFVNIKTPNGKLVSRNMSGAQMNRVYNRI